MTLLPILFAIQAQMATIIATVSDSAGNPLPDAILQLVGTSRRGTSDARGRVVISGVSPGKYTVSVRHLGYRELTSELAFTAGLVEPAYILFIAPANLQKVVVKASELKPDRYDGTTRFDAFYRRRSQGLGTFLTREMIDARRAQKSEDLLRMITGVRIRYRGSTPSIQFLRCDKVNVYIDGIRSHDGFRDYSALSPLDIEAMEVYHGLATVPPEFSPEPNDCAAIVVWTRYH
jgi:hypothetical protein